MIYVIESGEYFKVGYSSNFKKRLESYATHSPTFKVVHTLNGDKSLEKFIHTSLKEHSYNREWFNIFSNYLDCVLDIVDKYEHNTDDYKYYSIRQNQNDLLLSIIKYRLANSEYEELKNCKFITDRCGEDYINNPDFIDCKLLSKSVVKKLFRMGVVNQAKTSLGDFIILNTNYPNNF